MFQVSLIVAIDAEILNGDITHLIELLVESIGQIGTVTEFHRLTLIHVDFGGTFTVLLQNQQFADLNELTAIVNQVLRQPALLQPFGSKTLCTNFLKLFCFQFQAFLVLSLWSVTEFLGNLSNNTDTDINWLLVLTTGDFGDYQEEEVSQLQTRIKEAVI